MKQILAYMRKAITDYEMISPGDRILVGISGGKDSLVLFTGLARLRSFLGIPFDIVGLTLDMGYGGPNAFEPITQYAEKLEAKYIIKPSDIGEVVFVHRKEPNPCSLCARMRRGAIHDAAKELSCNKVALGHHADDAAETLIMNLFNEGRIGCFSPVTYMSRKDLTVIRPLVYATEKEIAHAARVCEMPVTKTVCPADGKTERQWTKEFLSLKEKESPGITKRVYGAIKRSHINGW